MSPYQKRMRFPVIMSTSWYFTKTEEVLGKFAWMRFPRKWSSSWPQNWNFDKNWTNRFPVIRSGLWPGKLKSGWVFRDLHIRMNFQLNSSTSSFQLLKYQINYLKIYSDFYCWDRHIIKFQPFWCPFEGTPL